MKNSIQKDSGEILILLYNKYKKGKYTFNSKEIVKETKWDNDEFKRAIIYLVDLQLIKIMGDMPSKDIPYLDDIDIDGISPEAIDLVEKNKNNFKKHFGFKVGIPSLFEFSWGVSQR